MKVLKKSIAFLLCLLLCGAIIPAFAETAESEKPTLVAANILYLPLKNRVAYSHDLPNTPDGIVLELIYSDGSRIADVVQAGSGDGFCSINHFRITVSCSNHYKDDSGTNHATLSLNRGQVELDYTYKSRPLGEERNIAVLQFFEKIYVAMLLHVLYPLKHMFL